MSNLKKMYIGMAIGYAILLLISLFSLGIPLGLFEMSAGKLIFWATIAHFLLSIWYVNADQVGARIVLGYPIDSVTGGIHPAPFGLTDFRKDTVNIVQNEYPGEPWQIVGDELVWRKLQDSNGDTKPENLMLDKYGKLVPMYVPPIRIPTGRPLSDKGKSKELAASNPLDIQATIEPRFIVRWQIQEEKYLEQFIINIGGFHEVVRQIEDTVVRTMSRLFSSRTVQKIIDEFQEINDEIKRVIDEETQDWGISVRHAEIKTIGLSHDLNSALTEVGIKKSEAMARIITAEAEKQELIQRGRGEAKARELLLLSEGKGLKGIADTLGISENDVIELVRLKSGEKAVIEAKNLTSFLGSGNQMGSLLGLAGEMKERGQI